MLKSVVILCVDRKKEKKKVRSFAVFAINVWSFSVCLQLEAVPDPFRGVTQACRPHTFLKRIKACHAIDRYVLLNCFFFLICCRRDRLTVMLGLVVVQSPCVMCTRTLWESIVTSGFLFFLNTPEDILVLSWVL